MDDGRIQNLPKAKVRAIGKAAFVAFGRLGADYLRAELPDFYSCVYQLMLLFKIVFVHKCIS